MRATVEDVPDEGDPYPFGSLRELDTHTPLYEREYLSTRHSRGHQPEQIAGEGEERPSRYLYSRCPLCFGPNVRKQTPHNM